MNKAAPVVLVIALLFGAGYLGMFLQERFKSTDSQIVKLHTEKQNLLNADSLQSAIEKVIIDSMLSEFEARDAKIDKLVIDLNIIRKRNEELEKKYNSIRVDMPDY